MLKIVEGMNAMTWTAMAQATSSQARFALKTMRELGERRKPQRVARPKTMTVTMRCFDMNQNIIGLSEILHLYF